MALSELIKYEGDASGKSNVYGAFSFMVDYVKNSFYLGGNSGRRTVKAAPSPYLFDRTSREKSSEFEVFYVDDTIYNFFNAAYPAFLCGSSRLSRALLYATL